MKRKFLISVLLLAFAFSTLTGCGPKSICSAQDAVVPHKIKEPFLISNNLETDMQNFTLSVRDKTVQYYAPQIKNPESDKKIQSLNTMIKKDIEDFAAEALGELGGQDIFIGAEMRFAANNLLSICVNTFYDTTDYGILYNLRSGNRLTLKDVFVKGTDYVTLLNRLIPPAILKGTRSEENLMRTPFTTIKPDQDFALTTDSLYIVFAKGESGFADRHSIQIPLSDIDAYVDVFDKFVDDPLRQSNGLKCNNIFITYHGNLIRNKAVKVYAKGLSISGLHNAWEEKVKAVLKNAFEDECKKANDAAAKIEKDPEYDYNPTLSIHMSPYFNHYGIFSVNMNVWANIRDFHYYSRILTFDLKNHRLVDPKDILTAYVDRNKGYSDELVSILKDRVRLDYSTDTYFTSEFVKKFNYQMLIDKSEIYFNCYFLQNDPSIILRFPANTFDFHANMLEIMLPFRNNIPTTLDDFFKR